MALESYRKKRDFARTPEPPGRVRAAGRGSRFVVQKHDASRLHYDFRLELDGVLKSWAIPKGPSLDPAERRLAMETEDHPLEYAGFEGVIPEGEYGGGTVMVWDRGTWSPVGDARAGFEKGNLKFRLDGEKLRGGWALVRMRGRPGDRGRSWLIIKERDGEARRADRYDVEAMRPESVASGRDLDGIARARDAVWRSSADGDPDPAPPLSRRGARGASSPLPPRNAAGKGQGEGGGVRLTHPDRVLYPDPGITKRELAAFYEDIAGWILPHLRGRPTSLVRCPDGADGSCFYQKHADRSASDALRRVRIREKTGSGDYLVVDDVPGLVGLVQMSILEIHTWNARAGDLERPDRIVIDLDPAEDVAWKRVLAAARLVRERLRGLGLESFVKTTGGKGLHVVAPIAPGPGWSDCAAFARGVADGLARERPREFLATASKAERSGRIFLDWLRNARGATSVTPYSTRARPGAPVSTPLRWDELEPRLRSDRFTVRNLRRRLSSLREDPWAGYGELRQRLPAAGAPEARAE